MDKKTNSSNFTEDATDDSASAAGSESPEEGEAAMAAAEDAVVNDSNT